MPSDQTRHRQRGAAGDDEAPVLPVSGPSWWELESVIRARSRYLGVIVEKLPRTRQSDSY
jgi:hypothetical protein